MRASSRNKKYCEERVTTSIQFTSIHFTCIKHEQISTVLRDERTQNQIKMRREADRGQNIFQFGLFFERL